MEKRNFGESADGTGDEQGVEMLEMKHSLGPSPIEPGRGTSGTGSGDVVLASHSAGEGSNGNDLVFRFQNVSYSVKVNKQWFAKLRGKSGGGFEERVLLDNISGELRSGQLTAIIGPSGSGKTTLLNAIAGRLQRKLRGGSFTVNGRSCSQEEFKQISAYVIQDDIMFETLTPREILTFSALLRLPPSIPNSEKRKRVEQLLEDLELRHCADTRIGTAGIKKGVSGGERKRVSIGTEVITDPSIVLLDEPTSGLDSYMARTVVTQLQHLARSQNKIIVTTIHQPSSDTFKLFDNLIVLSKGKIAYQGPTSEASQYFASLGYRCPQFTNPAEFYLDLVQAGMHIEPNVAPTAARLPSSPASGFSNEERVTYLLDYYQRLQEDQERERSSSSASFSSISTTKEFQKSRSSVLSLILHKDSKKESLSSIVGSSRRDPSDRNSLLREFIILLWRSSLALIRNPMVVRARFGQAIFVALLSGLVFLNVSDDQQGIQDRQGFLFFSLMGNVMPALMGVLIQFPQEKAVFFREFAAGAYRPFSYFMAKNVADLPYNLVFPMLYCVIAYFLVHLKREVEAFFIFYLVTMLAIQCGASLGLTISTGFSDVAVAMSMAPLVFIPFVLFGGFFQNSDSNPDYLSWLGHLSPFKYGFGALAANEFRGLKFKCSKEEKMLGICISKGEQVLQRLSLEDESIIEDIMILIGLSVGFRVVSYLFLEITARRRT